MDKIWIAKFKNKFEKYDIVSKYDIVDLVSIQIYASQGIGIC